MEVGAHSDAHFQFVSQDVFLSPGDSLRMGDADSALWR
jgi:hypothetical protein